MKLTPQQGSLFHEKEQPKDGRKAFDFGSVRSEDRAPGLGDPFDPQSPDRAPQISEKIPPKVETATDRKAAESPRGQDMPPPMEHSVELSKPPAISGTNSLAESGSARPPDMHKDEDAKPSRAETRLERAKDEARSLASEIAAKLGTGLDHLPASIDVKTTDEGLLISLTDRQAFEMFKAGSAEPEPSLVRLVEAVAAVISARPGYIVIRGHTDSRPYRNKKYDNWQLSTARAHLAQYMLIRGGLDESRIRRIEGFADREPLVKDDPQAPENRRIEILLGRDGP